MISNSFSLLFLFMILFSAADGIAGQRRETSQTQPAPKTNIKAGWNLGNSLDVHNLSFSSRNPEDYETHWNNPPVTEELIIKVKEAGFQSIRIPVTWYPHMDRNYIVSNRWMNRVQEVVDYCINNGLDVIINAHHEDWYDPDDENMEQALFIMETLWKQIGGRFAGYGEKLLFEGMNEPRLRGTRYEWNSGTREARKNVNVLNKKFVDTIRSLGGNNSGRYLLVPTYCAIVTEETLSDFELPPDDRLIVSVHFYQPLGFAQRSGDVSVWKRNNANDTSSINRIMKLLDTHLIKKGIPVMITEFAASDKNNEADRIAWVSYIKEKTSELGISCYWWDNGRTEGDGRRGYSLIDRNTGKLLFPGIVAAFTSK